jgi:hypothetical protein
MVVLEVGHDDDVDPALRDAVIERAGTPLSEDDSDDVVDVVLLWFREDDGDLVDLLMDARTRLDAAGSIWVLTPKAGRDGHVEPSDIIDAAPTAGLSQTSTVQAGQDWTASRLVVPSPDSGAGALRLLHLRQVLAHQLQEGSRSRLMCVLHSLFGGSCCCQDC